MIRHFFSVRSFAWTFFGFAGMLLLLVPPAAATTAKEYEHRIAALESRIDRLESVVNRLTSDKTASAVAAPSGPQQAVDPTTASGADLSASDPGADPSSEAKPSDEDKTALSKLYVIRDAAVTLRPGSWQTGLEFNYTRADALLQTSWALSAVASLRYGVGNGLEFGVRIPYDITHRVTETGTPGGSEVDLSSLGDISFDVSKLVWHEGVVMPGIVVSGSITLPTGVDPYSQQFQTPGKSPSNPFTFYRNAGGHYSADIGVELFKTVDPFAYFGGFSVNYPFERSINGIDVFPGYTFSYNLGATLALSETTSLGFSVLGAIHTEMTTGGKAVPNSSTMPVSASISILQRLANNTYIEPSITMGLTSDAPGSIVAVKLTKTY